MKLKLTLALLAITTSSVFAMDVTSVPVTKTRAQVQSELAEAIRTGDMIDPTDISRRKFNEIYPNQYPAKAAAAGKTRAQVQSELAEAIRTGDMIDPTDISRRKFNEIYSSRYTH
jgi:5-methylcytosine-specific restriction endonuclease McrBC GTP-binding regulatory subunit McrB